jgi:methionine biosynthesis protein MetW
MSEPSSREATTEAVSDPVSAFYERYHRPAERGFDLSYVRDPLVYHLLESTIPAGGRCLDVGCGDGRAMAGLVRQMDLRYTGTDIATEAIDRTRALGLAAELMSSGRLPFADASFDAVTWLEVIEHDFAPEATMHEVLRVLRPGGVLCVSTPNVAYWRRRLDVFLLGRWNPYGYSLAVSEPWGDPHIRFFTPRSLGGLMGKVGFERVRVHGTGGGLLLDVPGLGRTLRAQRHHASPPYRLLQRWAPSVFGCFLMGIGYRPA